MGWRGAVGWRWAGAGRWAGGGLAVGWRGAMGWRWAGAGLAAADWRWAGAGAGLAKALRGVSPQFFLSYPWEAAQNFPEIPLGIFTSLKIP